MDENAFLKAIRKLDQEALVSVFEHFAPMLFKYVVRICNDPQEADDVVGEVFSRLLDRLIAGKGPRKNLRSYLYQIAYHVVVDDSLYRKHYVALDDLSNQPQGDLLPPEQAEQKRRLGLLQAAIDSALTDDQKHVIMLRFFEGFDVSETASILGKEINNVKVIQNRAITKLRETLSNDIEDL